MEINHDETVESHIIGNKSEGVELWVKLKIPKQEEGLDEKIECQNKTERICDICGKVFRSGKAIGGHMRIHLQKNNLKAHQKRRDEKAIEEPICKLCGKGFPSMKSLYGHMRLHPERAWRGIHPPAEKASSSSSSSPSIHHTASIRAVDLTESLLRWPMKARRGRKATAVASSSEVSSSEDHQMLDAVYQLMMLSKGNSPERMQSESDTEIVENVLETQLVIDQTRNEIVENISETQLVIDQTQTQNEEIEVVAGINVVGNYGGDQINNNSLKVIIKKKMMMKKKRKKKKLLCDLKVYKCSTCDRSFSTHQALGGHSSSHNNKFNSVSVLTTTSDDDDDDHKAQSIDTSQKVMDIDLNEAPALEDEAGFGTD